MRPGARPASRETALALVAALALLLAGCGERDAAEEGRPAAAGASAVPASLPADVPLPEDARIVGEVVARDDGVLLSLESDAPAAALLDDYRRALAAMGWTLEPRQDAAAASGGLSASKGDRSLVLQVSGRKGGSQVVLRTGRAPEPPAPDAG